MARGDMAVDALSVANEIEILNRKEFEAVPDTINFSSVTATEGGKKIVKAGTPIKASGVPIVSGTTFTDAIGLALHDVYEDRPQVAVLKRGYVNKARWAESTGLTYADGLATALNAATVGCNIIFE